MVTAAYFLMRLTPSIRIMTSGVGFDQELINIIVM